MAQFWGKKDIEGIRRTVGLSLSFSLAVSALFTVAAAAFPAAIIGIYSTDEAVIAAGADYLRTLSPAFAPFAVIMVTNNVMRSIERVRLPMIATIAALTTNALLNWLLIFGVGPFPALGVVGAAAATVVSRFLEMGILIIGSSLGRYSFAGNPREFLGFDVAFVRRFLRVVFPVIVNEVVWALGISMQNVILARTGTVAIAAFNILNTVSQLTWVLFMGMGNGASVLVGKKIGMGDTDMAREYASRIVRFAPLLAGFAALLLLPLSRLLPFVFNVEADVFTALRVMVVILVLSYPFRAFNMSMIIGVCRAGGDTVFCVVYDVLFMWIASLPAAALASFMFDAPVWVVYLCLCMEEPLKMVLGLWRLKSGKWLHDVTRV